MNDIEEGILYKIDENLPVLFAVTVTIIGMVVRYSLFDFVSGDAMWFLLPWYDEIAQYGLYTQVGDYNFTYQCFIWILTKLPLQPLYGYKIFSCVFDYFLAASLAWLAKCCMDSANESIDKKNKEWITVLVYATIVLCPIVFMNSAMWAQCDVVFSTFIILALCFFAKEQHNKAFALLGVAFSFKLQTVFILPFFLFSWYKKRSFSILHFFLIPLGMMAMNLPMICWGRSLWETVGIYFSQTSTYERMAMNYPSVWTLFCDVNSSEHYILLKPMAILLAIFVIALLMIWWVRMDYKIKGINIIIMAFLSAYTCVLFLPSMHERYGYIYEMLSILLAVTIPKTIPLCVSLQIMTYTTYSAFLFGLPVDLNTLAYINIGVWLAYIFVFRNVLGKER